MDDIKDVQGRNFSKFLDTEVRTDPFGDNHSGERAYRRAERLVAGIFLLTNHIDSRERLRQEVRSNAISLLDHILALRDEMRSTTSPRVTEFQARVRCLISQIRMLVFAGFVSSQNAETVSGALDELGNFIHLSQRTNLSESVRFVREDFLNVRELSKGHIRDIKDSKVVKDKETVKDTQQSQEEGVAIGTSIMTSRASSILEILRAGGEMNIRDVSANLPEYGEKTIQRELGVLIERGLVRRSGLKRWSRYAIAQ
jgi:hypothetical protein